MDQVERSWTLGETLLFTFVAVLVLVLLIIPPFVAPAFVGMYKDFSGHGSPDTSKYFSLRFATSWWGPFGAALACAGCMLRGALGRGASRGASFALGALLGLFAIGFCMYGFYMPIFDLAGNVKP
ncbi:MAG: hypothetical protein AB7K71_18470 [Polyangiaceae bacterium]